ncbi:hypothetical protein CBW65_01875 [Tumebacillus avium]|uniref:Uncharacterized protein n=1 Tax=Tumebacillus avium TaxID=1903704 RepID=A0A1Y0IK99_9BACL|nr:hypothetical protein [Tumebacillus avium]ARU59945.1 hypothetical protein CBW65_01875 [Tumebacillus avium]
MAETKVELIGLYHVPENVDLLLVEVLVDAKPSVFDAGEFTQEDERLPKESWQVAYDELYLNADGNELIGDFMRKPEVDTVPARLVFFMYFLDVRKPLLTPFGQVELTEPTKMPDRLLKLVETPQGT